MHPALRADWAATWAKLLAPGATLITLQFPVSADMDPAVGPPFAVTPQLYDDVMLGPAEVFEKVAQREVPPALSHPSREAQEHLAIWRRK